MWTLSSNATCPGVFDVTPSDQCAFVKSYCMSEEYQLSNIDYLSLYYCTFGRWHAISIFPLLYVLLMCFIALGLTASDYLCPNLFTLSKVLKLSDNLAGLTLLALGNGAADVLSTYRALNLGESSLAVSELMGASLFITTIVIGSVSIVSPFKVPSDQFVRDIGFYIAIILMVLASILNGSLAAPICIALVAIYVLYVVVVIYTHAKQKARARERLRQMRSRAHHEDYDMEDIDEIYLDNLAGLPTIDQLHLSAPVSGQVKTLVKELAKHSNHGHIYLHDDENRENNTHNTRREHNISSDGDISGAKVRLLKFLPPFSDFTNGDVLQKVSWVFSYPISVVLKLSIPVRDRYIEEEITRRARTQTPSYSVEINTEESEFDFESDKELLSCQMLFAVNILNIVLFGSSTLFWKLLFPLGMVISLAAYYQVNLLYSSLLNKKNYFQLKTINAFGAFVGFLVSLSWISFFATEIISILKSFSIIFKLSEAILGVTVFALGNSVGDFIANLTISRMGIPLMAFGACFGGPILSLCSLGLSGFVVLGGSAEINEINIIKSKTLLVTTIALLLNMITILVGVPRNNWMLDRKFGMLLVGNWLLAITICIILEFVR